MITLVTGASSSGKSLLAETIAVNSKTLNNSLFYIATMHSYGDDGKKRILRHREMRADKGFSTIEKYIDIGNIDVPPNSVCLLECLSNLLANEMYDNDGAKDNADIKIIGDIENLESRIHHLIIVTNEIFSDGIIYDEFCNKYINKMGYINFKISEMAQTVIESVVGIPVYHKGK